MAEFEPACPNCRYDLTGIPDGPCPECGRPFTLHALRNPPPKPTILTDVRFYCALVGTFTLIAFLQAGAPATALGAALAALLVASLLVPGAGALTVRACLGVLMAGAGLIVLGLGLDLLVIGIDAHVRGAHWTRLNNPLVPATTPLADRVVTRTQCLDASAALIPAGLIPVFLARERITTSARALLSHGGLLSANERE